MRKLTKEPLVRISKRDGMKWYASWGIRFAAILLALLLNALFLYLIAGLSPAEVYETIFKGAFGNKIYRLDTLIYTAKLLCISVALAPAFKMRFWNVGAEGQVLMGALATAIVMVYFGSSLPTWALFTVMAVSAVVLGAIWGLIPAIFKANFGTNETLFTLMMNYVAISWWTFTIINGGAPSPLWVC